MSRISVRNDYDLLLILKCFFRIKKEWPYANRIELLTGKRDKVRRRQSQNQMKRPVNNKVVVSIHELTGDIFFRHTIFE